ncbi:MAG: T9SS type A sorting domain-containing protein [Bacteroidia bacterium]
MDTSACYLINTVGLGSLSGDTNISICRPTKGVFTVAFETVQPEVEVVVTNNLGQLVSRNHFANTKNIEAAIDSPPGIYFVTIQITGQLVKALVKE